ncbi:type III secretion system export apparatus subunit SctS [Burkholderia ambifaria]|uniref:type III secretion system export apparatus subunit SctS n=1 Tax=Burkholderia ambifaria TaxID=152480 RepID=UPI001592319D|nr:type III secretion system export apparatus subunit SctS [Burkholderia ambifaria]
MNTLFYTADKALYLIVVLSAVPILVATVVGVVVALIQAVTHLQEQTLPFGIKLLAVGLCLYLSFPWIGSRVQAFSEEALRLAFR